MIDGQHRCHAVIRSGKPIEFLIITGFDRENTFGKVDDIKARKLNDWLSIEGEANPDVLAAVIGFAYRDSMKGSPYRRDGIFLTPTEGMKFLSDHPELRDSVTKAPATVNRYASRSMCAFLHWKFAKKDKMLANEFFIDLVTGELEGEGDPIYLLRERMKSDRRATRKMKPMEKMGLFIKAWNAVRTDSKLPPPAGLRYMKSEKFPVVQ
jgi:hypothetical protein